jgi:hypothetical protein
MHDRTTIDASTTAYRNRIRRFAAPASVVFFVTAAFCVWWLAPPSFAVLGYGVAGCAMFLSWQLSESRAIASHIFQLVFFLLVAILPSKFQYAPFFSQLLASISALLFVFFALVWVSQAFVRAQVPGGRAAAAPNAADEA